LLIKLEDANVKAGFEAIRQRYLGLRAMQGRLMTEQLGKNKIQFHPDLEAAASDPLIAQQMRNQEMLLQTRQSALQAELQSFEENIQGQEVSIQTLEAILQNRRGQLALLTDELNNTRNLVKDGYAPRNRQLELERMVAESSSAIADSQGNILRSKRSIAELRQRAILRKQEYRKEVESQIADITREVLGDAEKFRAVKEELARTEIYAPASGQVVSLSTPAAGAVIAAGQKLMDIVPAGQPLLLETKVLPNMIDRVHAGMPVDVRFSTFAHTPQLVVEGQVLSISNDVVSDGPNTLPYFLARVTVTPEGLKTLGKRQMQPGMPVEVVFKTGERSLLTYLLSPLTKRVAASMTEE
jgi:protease secretion system membrane fusion protein